MGARGKAWIAWSAPRLVRTSPPRLLAPSRTPSDEDDRDLPPSSPTAPQRESENVKPFPTRRMISLSKTRGCTHVVARRRRGRQKARLPEPRSGAAAMIPHCQLPSHIATGPHVSPFVSSPSHAGRAEDLHVPSSGSSAPFSVAPSADHAEVSPPSIALTPPSRGLGTDSVPPLPLTSILRRRRARARNQGSTRRTHMSRETPCWRSSTRTAC